MAGFTCVCDVRQTIGLKQFHSVDLRTSRFALCINTIENTKEFQLNVLKWASEIASGYNIDPKILHSVHKSGSVLYVVNRPPDFCRRLSTRCSAFVLDLESPRPWYGTPIKAYQRLGPRLILKYWLKHVAHPSHNFTRFNKCDICLSFATRISLKLPSFRNGATYLNSKTNQMGV